MPLSPIVMTPVFRHGAQTPWGGDRLRRVFGKEIPDARTGECLEVSAIAGLNATDAQGNTLSQLIARHGASLLGADAQGTFPLMLKLIDARDTLSVQVHPDDAYAALHENKLGKTEAWAILDAAPGARIVYGIRAGVTGAQLRAASEMGEGVESLLRFVPVQAGDVFYIPAGMVHAIGGGILLYEIQQSSDVTYRFYDWNRTDAQGNRRALHIRQALDVTDLSLYLDKAVPRPVADARCLRESLLDTRYFTLQRLSDCAGVPFVSDGRAFSILTALSAGEMRLAGETIALKAGQSALLPACCADFALFGKRFLLAAPGA